MGRNECFFWSRQYCWGDWGRRAGGGGGGGGWMNLKPIKQLSLRAITWVTSSFVLHSSFKKSIHYVLLNWKLYHVLYRSIEIFFLNVNNNSILGPLYSLLSRKWPLGLKARLPTTIFSTSQSFSFVVKLFRIVTTIVKIVVANRVTWTTRQGIVFGLVHMETWGTSIVSGKGASKRGVFDMRSLLAFGAS